MSTPSRATRIEWLSGHGGWVVRALDGRVIMGPFFSRQYARMAAKKYRLTGHIIDNLRLSDKSISTKTEAVVTTK